MSPAHAITNMPYADIAMVCKMPAEFLWLIVCGRLTNPYGNPQVRVIVERLARRCGYDAVAAAMPEGDRKLLLHIQKEQLRKKRVQSRAGSEVRL